MNENDKPAANAADLQQDKDNDGGDAYGRYNEYWLAFSDWCAARGISEDNMRDDPGYQAEFEREYYGD